MDFDSLVASMDDTLVSAFQKVDPAAGVLQLTIHPQDRSPDIIVPGIVKSPALEEDFVPGSPMGTGMLIFFVPPSANVQAVRGDTASYNGVDYDVLESDGDRAGGLHIKMRKRTQPWNT